MAPLTQQHQIIQSYAGFYMSKGPFVMHRHHLSILAAVVVPAPLTGRIVSLEHRGRCGLPVGRRIEALTFCGNAASPRRYVCAAFSLEAWSYGTIKWYSPIRDGDFA
jgi:hypothetical protein